MTGLPDASAGTTVLVTPQIPFASKNGGIGTFIYHFAKLLRGAGHAVEIIFTEAPEVAPALWQPFFRTLGIKVHCVAPAGGVPVGYRRFQYVSQCVDDMLQTIPDVRAVYLADWRANGLITVRRKRTSPAPVPPIVMVMHGNSSWHRENQGWWPSSMEECELEASERYVIENSDVLVSPSRYGVQWITDRGWDIAGKSVEVLNYPFFPAAAEPAPRRDACRPCKEVIFFGRVETRKGIELFIDSLERVAANRALGSIERIVLLGNIGINTIGGADQLSAAIVAATGLPVEIHASLDMDDALKLLRARVDGTLVVIPSRAETLGFVAIECSLIPGMNVICADSSALPEVFGGKGAGQLFPRTIAGLSARIAAIAKSGLMGVDELVAYDFERANAGWLAFHGRILAQPVPVVASVPAATAGRTVDICIPNYNLSRFLAQLLQSLDRQTDQRFNVFVLDDGSTDPQSITQFEALTRHYARPGWHFARQENTGVSKARNNLAAMSSAPYIIWMDADNVAAPNMVERFVEAIERTGDDLLSCNSYQFTGDGSPYLGNGSQLLRPASHHYIPIGNFASLGILGNPFGDLNVIMRRTAFEKVGGFAEDLNDEMHQEDRALFTRMSLSGCRMDVVPEFLYFYRVREDSRLRSGSQFWGDSGVVDIYREHLRQFGLEEMGDYLLGAHYAKNDLARTFHVQGNLPEMARGLLAADVARLLGYKILRRMRLVPP